MLAYNPSSSAVMSYCGLTSALKSSAGKEQREPISKQRNDWLQTTLIEAAKLAPHWNPQLAAVHQRELTRGHRNRATLVVARKLAAYLLAVDITTPDVLKVLQARQLYLPYRARVKPFNFIQSPTLDDLDGYPIGCDPSHFMLIAPFTSDLSQCYTRNT